VGEGKAKAINNASGAINEALSDIFGEFVDLTNSACPPDTKRDRELLRLAFRFS
jgi:hypothetical protein